jgi:hypothetical protein
VLNKNFNSINMKNKTLNIVFVFIMLFAMNCVKGQSLHQKLQAEMEIRKKRLEEVRLKVKEQQAQQQAEKRNEPNIPQQPATSSSSQPNIQPTAVQQNASEVRPATTKPIIKKPATVQQPALNGHTKKEELDQ